MFLHESESVIQRARAAAASRSQQSSSMLAEEDLTMEYRQTLQRMPHPHAQTLPVEAEHQAEAFFFSHHAVQFNFSLLPALYQGDSSGGPLSSALIAVGLAGLSNTTNAPEHTSMAHESYSVALSLTNTALRDSIESREDRTLMAVLLLGLYEVSSVLSSIPILKLCSTLSIPFSRRSPVLTPRTETRGLPTSMAQPV